jgi:hypothetical protein
MAAVEHRGAIPGSRGDCTLRGGVGKLVVAAGEVSMEGLGTSEQRQHFGRAVMCRYRGIMGWESRGFNLSQSNTGLYVSARPLAKKARSDYLLVRPSW